MTSTATALIYDLDRFPALSMLNHLGIKKPGQVGATTEPGKAPENTRTIKAEHQHTSYHRRLLDLEAHLEKLALYLEAQQLQHPCPVASTYSPQEATALAYDALRDLSDIISKQKG